ncbi:hypothetical protein ACQRC6_08040 [Peptoniphilus sp. SGI.035]|uniref:hypothetical protein n=1 Tax=Peptoniphilus sp. SGI.035 TaxID=3420564 RepID=UPI003D002EC7
MNIRELVINNANAKYRNNDYVSERVEKELHYFEKNKWFKDIEIILKIKENIKDQNIYVFPIGLLSLYLLDLEHINPMPAHYYNPKTKEIIFDDSVSYGVDLPKKTGLHRDGFDIPEDYALNLNREDTFKLYLHENHYELVKGILGNSNPYKSEKSKLWSNSEEVSFGSTKILFNTPAADNYLGKNLDKVINVEDFLKYKIMHYQNKVGDYFNDILTDDVESFDDMVELKALMLLNVKDFTGTHKAFSDSKYPKTREDISLYLKKNGYSPKDAAQIAFEISFDKNPIVDIQDKDIKKYFESCKYVASKASVLHLFLRDYCNGFYYEILGQKEKQNKLFSEWKKKYKYFSPDGIVDFYSYNNASLEITFILKETNEKEEDGGYDLTEFLRDGAVGGCIWNNVSRFSAGIIFKKDFEEVKDLDKYDREKYLAPISVINLKKTPGRATSIDSEIDKFAKEDREYIKKQVKICRPDLIICGGTGDIFIKNILNLNTSSWTYVSKYLRYLIYNDKLIVDTYHPACRKSKKELFENIVLPIRDILKNK